MVTLGSRAKLRKSQHRASHRCDHCGGWIRGTWKEPAKQIVANVYEGKRWVRVEILHIECYENLGRPYGEAE